MGTVLLIIMTFKREEINYTILQHPKTNLSASKKVKFLLTISVFKKDRKRTIKLLCQGIFLALEKWPMRKNAGIFPPANERMGRHVNIYSTYLQLERQRQGTRQRKTKTVRTGPKLAGM